MGKVNSDLRAIREYTHVPAYNRDAPSSSPAVDHFIFMWTQSHETGRGGNLGIGSDSSGLAGKHLLTLTWGSLSLTPQWQDVAYAKCFCYCHGNCCHGLTGTGHVKANKLKPMAPSISYSSPQGICTHPRKFITHAYMNSIYTTLKNRQSFFSYM